MFTFVLLFAACIVSTQAHPGSDDDHDHGGHKCIHDQLPPLLPHQTRRLTLHGGGHDGVAAVSSEEHSRRLSTSTGVAPIRIKWRIVDGDTDLTGADGKELEDMITTELMPSVSARTKHPTHTRPFRTMNPHSCPTHAGHGGPAMFGSCVLLATDGVICR